MIHLLARVAAILVLVPRSQGFAGRFAACIMGGAILCHFFKPIGMDSHEEGGKRFNEASFIVSMGLLLILQGIAALRTVALSSQRAKAVAVAAVWA